ncbi:hypothetical protein [Streptomyces sp. NPDC095613]|uniref:hypothetical protein n=1 Tax=Streptomyces sp. NPDC095613 TaxID=3155540 RepID=UPI00331FD93C
MNHILGTEIASTAQWLEEHGAAGAAMVLRRVARQRDDARRELAETLARDRDPQNDRIDLVKLRTEMARLQVQAERAGWVPDSQQRRLWKWREGWWELAFRKRNPGDGYPDSGWYLWGPAESYFGAWAAALKSEAVKEADRLITMHLAALAEAK